MRKTPPRQKCSSLCRLLHAERTGMSLKDRFSSSHAHTQWILFIIVIPQPPCQIHPYSSPRPFFLLWFLLFNNLLSQISVASIRMDVGNSLMINIPRTTSLKQTTKQQQEQPPDSSSPTALDCQQRLSFGWGVLSISSIHAGMLTTLILPRQTPLCGGPAMAWRHWVPAYSSTSSQIFHSAFGFPVSHHSQHLSAEV